MKYGPKNHAGDHTKPSAGAPAATGAGARSKMDALTDNPRSSFTDSTPCGTASGLIHYGSNMPPKSLGRKAGKGTNI